MYVLGHVETSLVKSPFRVIAITLPFIDPVYTVSYILVNAFIRRPAYCGPVRCKYMQGVWINVQGVRWAVHVRSCLDLGKNSYES